MSNRIGHEAFDLIEILFVLALGKSDLIGPGQGDQRGSENDPVETDVICFAKLAAFVSSFEQ